MNEAARICREVFGHAELREHQRQVIEHVLGGDDCLAVLPTGSGKSLCYALPALLRPGVVLVVSPLIALIRDQVRRFAARGVPVVSLDSLQTPEEKDATWRMLEDGVAKLVFVSPERLARIDFRERIARVPLSLVAIDEAHCVSQWGNHFRPDYRMLGEYLAALETERGGGRLPRLALTATATTKVRLDIETRLGLVQPRAVLEDFVRDNLRIKVLRADRSAEQLSAALNAVLATEGQGIVYAPTRKAVEELARMLRDARVEVVAYHGGLAGEQRHAAHKRFADGSARVVVATHAFGMGIDKADIRFVHHVGLPGSLEQYVQEIGRAGRDGAPAACWLIYGPRDYYVQKFMIDKSFPELAALEGALAAAAPHVRAGAMASERTLVAATAEALGAEPRVAREALEVLCREGLLAAFRQPGGAGEILITEGALGEAPRFFAEYPLRKEENLAKLDAMKAYAGAGDDRRVIIEDYFRS